jgi:hypothetical protein
MTEEEIALAISLAEEEERKKRELQLQREEEESLRQALEASLKVSESPILATALEQLTERSIQTAATRGHRLLQSAREIAQKYYQGLPEEEETESILVGGSKFPQTKFSDEFQISTDGLSKQSSAVSSANYSALVSEDWS